MSSVSAASQYPNPTQEIDSWVIGQLAGQQSSSQPSSQPSTQSELSPNQLVDEFVAGSLQSSYSPVSSPFTGLFQAFEGLAGDLGGANSTAAASVLDAYL